jgi:hypothetical protein
MIDLRRLGKELENGRNRGLGHCTTNGQISFTDQMDFGRPAGLDDAVRWLWRIGDKRVCAPTVKHLAVAFFGDK